MKASLSFERRPYDPGERLNREFAHYLHYGEFMATPHTDKGECYCSDCVYDRDIAMSKDYIIALLKSDLQEAVRLMREHAATAGPRSFWCIRQSSFHVSQQGHRSLAGQSR